MQLLGSRLEDSVLTFVLQKGAVTTTELLKGLRRKHACTKQGFYRALRKLRAQEKVIVYRSAVSVSEHWLKQLRQLVEYKNSSILGDFSQLERGEEITLTIHGLTAMDRIWSHLFSVIEKGVPHRQHLYLFNPHNWSSVLRGDSDKSHDMLLGAKGRRAYLLIGSSSALDKLATRELAFSNVEVSYSPKVRQEVFIAVIHEWVIEVRFNPKARKAVELLFKTETDLERAKDKLKKLDHEVTSKVKIAKDPGKAAAWKRRISKDFHIRR
ncbi:MAG: hypothetical protein WDN10_03700 [bacterium]